MRMIYAQPVQRDESCSVTGLGIIISSHTRWRSVWSVGDHHAGWDTSREARFTGRL